jgi:hypothetical protein
MEALILVAETGGPTMLARMASWGIEPRSCPRVYRAREEASLGAPEAEERPMKTVWIYVDTSKQVGDRDHLKVFATSDLSDEWFLVNDPEGVVFEYEVIGAVDDETG